VRAQILDALAGLPSGDEIQALVIAGDWYEIPFRYPLGEWYAGSPGYQPLPQRCPSCDNGVYEYSADLAYANLDDDPWSVPDVPVGRLMSPDADLLAIQTVVGIWGENGAFEPAGDAAFLGLLGTDRLEDSITAWAEAFSGQIWSVFGPEVFDAAYRLDRDEFFHIADRSEVVVAHAHGHPDFLSPNGAVFNQAVSGRHLIERRGDGVPSFWFLHACGTGKPDMRDGVTDETLLVGLQSRSVFGALMAVENLAAASADPAWWTAAVEPGLPVGELVRRFVATGAEAYRDGEPTPAGLPATTGSVENKRSNGLAVLSWIGDPLTPVESW